jgi:hypothetical protein
MEGLGRHRPVPLGHKDVRGRPLFALQTPQRASPTSARSEICAWEVEEAHVSDEQYHK